MQTAGLQSTFYLLCTIPILVTHKKKQKRGKLIKVGGTFFESKKYLNPSILVITSCNICSLSSNSEMSASYLLSVTWQSCEFHSINNKGPINMVLSKKDDPLPRATLLSVLNVYMKKELSQAVGQVKVEPAWLLWHLSLLQASFGTFGHVITVGFVKFIFTYLTTNLCFKTQNLTVLDRYLIDTTSKSLSTVGRESTNFRLIHRSQSTLGQLLTNCWKGSIGMSIEHWSRCWSRVSIEYRSTLNCVCILYTWSN